MQKKLTKMSGMEACEEPICIEALLHWQHLHLCGTLEGGSAVFPCQVQSVEYGGGGTARSGEHTDC